MQHFNPVLKQIVPGLGKRRDYDNTRIQSVLGWEPRSQKEMTISMAESMIEFGVV